MKKRNTISGFVLLAYLVPYVFLGMYGDITYHSMWPYGLMLVAMTVLGYYCVKTKRVAIGLLGNLLSTLVSCLLVQCFATQSWDSFFKAFPCVIRALQFSGLMLAVQIVPWWFAKVTE